MLRDLIYKRILQEDDAVVGSAIRDEKVIYKLERMLKVNGKGFFQRFFRNFSSDISVVVLNDEHIREIFINNELAKDNADATIVIDGLVEIGLIKTEYAQIKFDKLPKYPGDDAYGIRVSYWHDNSCFSLDRL